MSRRPTAEAAVDQVPIPQLGHGIPYHEFKRLISAFSRIKEDKVRKQFVALMELVAEDEPTPAVE